MSDPQNTAQKEVSVLGFTSILDALKAKGLIDGEIYKKVRLEAINSNKDVEQILIDGNILGGSEVAQISAEMKGVGYIDLNSIAIAQDTLNIIDKKTATDNSIVIFESDDDLVKVAMLDPLDLQKIKFIESLVGKRVEAFYASASDIKRTIDSAYGAQISREVGEALEEVEGLSTLELEDADLNTSSEEDLESAPIIKIVNMILEYGIKNKASDIHIEPRDGKVAVRFRVSGVLTEKLAIPQKLLAAVSTRIKILSNLKIDEKRLPQDGRFQVKDEEHLIDVRVSVMPGIYGEKIVMRLLEKSYGIMSLEQTGIRGLSYGRLKDALKRTQGIILVTGPVGSGKTQTLASCIKILNSEHVNIITLEDPVEIRIDGVNQTQVNAGIGLTFATGLRSMLRQDPDIIMVGEIRDAETAELAIQAALVGRLVLATLHTNSAAGSFIRLIDMGIESFLLTSTVNASVAQRLVRTLCDCKEEFKAPPELVKELHSELDGMGSFTVNVLDREKKASFGKDTQDVTLYKPKGCVKCNQSGYSGRTGIFEVLTMSDEISKLVLGRSSIKKIHKQALKEGMVTMIQDGYIKAIQGITTLEEVLRVRNE